LNFSSERRKKGGFVYLCQISDLRCTRRLGTQQNENLFEIKHILLDLHHRSLSYPPVGKIRAEDSVRVPPPYGSLERGKEEILPELYDDEDFEDVSPFAAWLSVMRYN
jgi:hypothetical protein